MPVARDIVRFISVSLCMVRALRVYAFVVCSSAK
jgi:hypothetical protein